MGDGGLLSRHKAMTASISERTLNLSSKSDCLKILLHFTQDDFHELITSTAAFHELD